MLSVDQINKLEAENERLNKELETAVTQYNAVVAQNKDLQKELNQCKKCLEEVKIISDNYNLTVNKRRELIANKIKEVIPA